MKIIIVGAGKVGSTLADYLSMEEHDITIVDNDEKAIQRASNTLDVMCIKGPGAAPSVLREAGADEALVHAVVCHGFSLCSDVEPVHVMEKVLFAADELTGLIGAAARMRPSKSVQDMEVGSLKKKFKDKKFAAGCSRDVISQGAERLGWDLDVLLERTILAMRSCEERVNGEMAALAEDR